MISGQPLLAKCQINQIQMGEILIFKRFYIGTSQYVASKKDGTNIVVDNTCVIPYGRILKQSPTVKDYNVGDHVRVDQDSPGNGLFVGMSGVVVSVDEKDMTDNYFLFVKLDEPYYHDGRWRTDATSFAYRWTVTKKVDAELEAEVSDIVLPQTPILPYEFERRTVEHHLMDIIK